MPSQDGEKRLLMPLLMPCFSPVLTSFNFPVIHLRLKKFVQTWLEMANISSEIALCVKKKLCFNTGYIYSNLNSDPSESFPNKIK